MSILLIEQNLRFATAVAENTHVVVTGQVAYNGSIKELLSDQDLTQIPGSGRLAWQRVRDKVYKR